MSTPTLPHPDADSPQVVVRLVEMVARGVRSARGLEEALGLTAQGVRAALHTGQWLGLLELSEDTWLTPLGLELAYAEHDRPAIYARAVWSTPIVTALMSGRDPDLLPPVVEVVPVVANAAPDLSAGAARRRATAIRALIAPALGPASRAPVAHQLHLPLATSARAAVPPQLGADASSACSPDAYRFLLGMLIDHGELTLGHLRGLLDAAGAHEAPLGGYVDLALSRGDATRSDDRLVVAPRAVEHADLVGSTPSVILSDPDYRAWLADLLTADRDRHAQIRRSQRWARFMPWDRRLFGRPASPDTLGADLERVLMDRSLDGFPVRGETGPAPIAVDAPYLSVWEQPGLLITLPPTLLALRGGLSRVNDLLRRARQDQSGVGPPGLTDRHRVAHGGLLHPGESLPRSIPDTRTLRQQLLRASPYVTLVAALLLLHRLDPSQLEVRSSRGQWFIRNRRRPVGALLPVLDGFLRGRGQLPSRRTGGEIDAGALLDVLERVGVAVLVAERAVLAEPFYAHLRREAEELQVYGALVPVAEALSDHLHTLPAHDERAER